MQVDISHLLYTALWKICQGGGATLMCEEWEASCKVRTVVFSEVKLFIIRNKPKDFKFTLNSGVCNILCESPEELHLFHYTICILVARQGIAGVYYLNGVIILQLIWEINFGNQNNDKILYMDLQYIQNIY